MPHRDAYPNTTKRRADRLQRVSKVLLPGVVCVAVCLSPLSCLAAMTGSKVSLVRGVLPAWLDRQGDVGALIMGVTIEREIKGGDTHHYHAKFEAGQYARIVI